MKGQATVEFMFMFLSVIAFITLLVAAMGLASKNASQQGQAIRKTIELEELIRIYEVYFNSGIIMVFGYEGESFLPEGNRIAQDYYGKEIIVEGVMDNSSTRIEPL